MVVAMSSPPRAQGILRVVSPDELSRAEMDEARLRAEAQNPPQPEYPRLAAFIRDQFEMMRNHRSSASGWNHRLIHAQRVFNGEYDPQKLMEIKKFQGSEVYARVIAVKARGASALLRDIYLASDRPWGLDPTPEPQMPDSVIGDIQQLVSSEVQGLLQSGQTPTPDQIRDRLNMLLESARRAAKKKSREESKKAEDKLDDVLIEGGFYKALAEFLVDLPLFPFACIKGPEVRIVPSVRWINGAAQIEDRPRMFWTRKSPFDIYFTPGVSDIEDAAVIERLSYTRADLNDVLGLPGYNEEAVRAVLREHGQGGLNDWLDPTDSERALGESRENPWLNKSNLISALEYHGNIQGKMLLEYGMTEQQVPDPDRDYFVQAWLIGRHIIKVQLSPSPRKRHPYYITSFEKVPGTPIGNALPDILGDVQDVCNATLRALVNNLSIASGPQVVIDDDMVVPGTDADSLYPWKRWHISRDPGSTNTAAKPVEFWQPDSRAQELLGVYEKFTQIADELSAIPRYVTGSERLGGAGRTASGLAMLMGNASKVLQNVAGNVDRDIFEPLLQSLYDMIMLTDQSGLFRGDEAIRVRGVQVAVQRETNRQRQLELLQITANPFDIEIMGPEGRASLLRSVSSEVGMEGQAIVPPEDELKKRFEEKAAQNAAMQAMAMQMNGQRNAGKAGGPQMGGPQGAMAQLAGNQPPKPPSQDLGEAEANTVRGIV